MKQSLSLKATQSLSLTPQLQQSIRILQLSAIELNSEIQEILETNPLLEEGDNNGQLSSDNLEKSSESNTDAKSEEWQQAFETRQTSSSGSKSSAEGGYDFDATTASNETLRDNLAWQIQMTKLSEKDKLIANNIIYSLTQQGYLSVTLEEILGMIPIELEAELDEVEAIHKLIQTLEPVGIGARDLRERLLMIIDNDIAKDSDSSNNHQSDSKILARSIICEHLELLGTRNLPKIKKMLGVEQCTLEDAVQYITQINPRIDNQFEQDNSDYIIPDIIVKKLNGRWRVELNPQVQKKLKVNNPYGGMPKGTLNGEASKYISDNLQEAKWFIKSLHNRYDTLKRVATAIVENQTEFLENGEQSLKPMVLQNIATELDLHESTISRATSQKYMLTPLGVFELKYFFSSSLSSEDGSSVSSTAIRSFIKKMIDEEPKQKPISDSKISKILDDQGYKVARRTVAKYREGMNIPSSSQRKSLI